MTMFRAWNGSAWAPIPWWVPNEKNNDRPEWTLYNPTLTPFVWGFDANNQGWKKSDGNPAPWSAGALVMSEVDWFSSPTWTMSEYGWPSGTSLHSWADVEVTALTEDPLEIELRMQLGIAFPPKKAITVSGPGRWQIVTPAGSPIFGSLSPIGAEVRTYYDFPNAGTATVKVHAVETFVNGVRFYDRTCQPHYWNGSAWVPQNVA